MLYSVVSCCLVLCCAVSCSIALCRVVLCCALSRVVLYSIVSCCLVLCRAVSCSVALCRVVSCCVVLGCAVLRCAVPRCIQLRRGVLCPVEPCRAGVYASYPAAAVRSCQQRALGPRPINKEDKTKNEVHPG